jgi:hypothetical protein
MLTESKQEFIPIIIARYFILTHLVGGITIGIGQLQSYQY